MAKFFGKVGYAIPSETSPGIFSGVTEQAYYGDVLDESYRWAPRPNQMSENIDLSNRISILADPYAIANYSAMRYVEYDGALWEVKSIQKAYPRLILTLGGVYNGETAD